MEDLGMFIPIVFQSILQSYLLRCGFSPPKSRTPQEVFWGVQATILTRYMTGRLGVEGWFTVWLILDLYSHYKKKNMKSVEQKDSKSKHLHNFGVWIFDSHRIFCWQKNMQTCASQSFFRCAACMAIGTWRVPSPMEKKGFPSRSQDTLERRRLWKNPIEPWKTPSSFPLNPGWLTGILIMIYNDPYITG